MTPLAWLVSLILVVVGVVHLIPVVGVLGGERLQALYGVRVDGPDLSILLRHRALLFGLVGGLLLAGAFHAPWRMLAVIVGLISTLGFLLISAQEGGGNAALLRVFRVDVVAAVALLLVLVHDVWHHYFRTGA